MDVVLEEDGLGGAEGEPAAGHDLAAALLQRVGDPAGARVARLKEQRAELLANKKRVAQQLRNEEKKRARLLAKARALSNDDLMTILGTRAAVAAKAKAKGKAQAAGQAKAKAKAKAAA